MVLMRRQALRRKGPCDVYWGSHGCHKQRGHIGLHWCSNNCIPCDGPHIFGDDWDRDAYIQQVADWIAHRQRIGKSLPAGDWRLPRNLDPAGWSPSTPLPQVVLTARQQFVADVTAGLLIDGAVAIDVYSAAGPTLLGRQRWNPDTRKWEAAS